jgi:DNA modification methylase
MSRAPGEVRDAVLRYLSRAEQASIGEIQAAISVHIGDVAPSSLRSYLNANTPGVFDRVERGVYALKRAKSGVREAGAVDNIQIDKARLFRADCLDWLAKVEPRSLHAIVTDPPYSPLEYSDKEHTKLREGKGGVWRIPPSFDGVKRSPLPRFTVLTDEDRKKMRAFFEFFGKLVLRATVPGANVVVASNPLLAHLVAEALADSGLEMRGHLVRLVQTMRGGDRPKNAHEAYPDVSVMPRSQFEPWIVLRHPLDGRVQDNLKKWKTGGFRRISDDAPFGDVIKSAPTPKGEKMIANHPSLKPQAFLRAVVRSVLPLGEGVVCDPFAGSGSALAAANAVGYESVGVERDEQYFALAKTAIPKLAAIKV